LQEDRFKDADSPRFSILDDIDLLRELGVDERHRLGKRLFLDHEGLDQLFGAGIEAASWVLTQYCLFLRGCPSFHATSGTAIEKSTCFDQSATWSNVIIGLSFGAHAFSFSH
jgi:hypothetical protein